MVFELKKEKHSFNIRIYDIYFDNINLLTNVENWFEVFALLCIANNKFPDNMCYLEICDAILDSSIVGSNDVYRGLNS